jgi:LysM repeat protein
MYRDEDDERELRGLPADDKADYKTPIEAGSGAGCRQPRPPMRPQARLRTAPTRGSSTEPWTPAMLPRRGPSHPDWERPLTQYDYPELRGREEHRAIWPLAAAAMGVLLVVVVLVIIPTLLGGHGGGAAAATGTPKATASASVAPNASGASANPSATVTAAAPQASIFYATHYTVKAGDRFAAIAKFYKLQAWELLQANPQLKNPSLITVGMVLNIPFPGQLTKATPSPVATPTPVPTPTPTPTPAG